MQKHCSIDQKDTGVFLSNERKTKWVALITLVTMFVEIAVGYWSGSMALLADGWHMASHALALFLSLIVYYLYRNPRFQSAFTFGGGKILSLGGYTSSLLLLFIAGSMVVESISRFYEQTPIHYAEAIWVAVAGLIVNIICAMIMHQGEEKKDAPHEHIHGEHCSHGKNKLAPAGHSHGHSHSHNHGHSHSHGHAHDHNHESAYVHILTDALTSVFAIVALLLGQWQGWSWLDPAVGLLGGIVVFKWSLGLIRQSGMDLLDAHDSTIDQASLVKTVEQDGSKVMDIHLWKLAPGQVGCEIVIQRKEDKHSADYRDIIQKEFSIQHLIIEVV